MVKGQFFKKFETSSSYPNKDVCQTVGNSGLDLKTQFWAGGTIWKSVPFIWIGMRPPRGGLRS